MSRLWTAEEKHKQSQLIKRWQPWSKSTGPKTQAGKEKSKMNARKHGGYCAGLKQYRQSIAQCRKLVCNIRKLYKESLKDIGK
jgi:hypothetical protein